MPPRMVHFVKVWQTILGINVAYTSICLWCFQAVPLAIYQTTVYVTLSTIGLKMCHVMVHY